MATHSSSLAWAITWTEEPGGLQSIGHKELDMTEATEHAVTRERERDIYIAIIIIHVNILMNKYKEYIFKYI